MGVFGAHRSSSKTVEILVRLVWWESMTKDVEFWVSKCITCLRFRSRPTKQDMVPVKRLDCETWQEVMVDFEGPSNPPDRYGNRYSLTYCCLLCHGVLLEPARALTGTEVRRCFSRCIFRSGTLPTLVRSDRGAEFKNAIMSEYTDLIGLRHRFGTPWRPMEQGVVERSHQESQKVLGYLMQDVFKANP